jgi:CcmD family protein
MKKLISSIFCLLAILFSQTLMAQSEVEMADGMRSEGKIYVVVAIILIVLTGLIVYLFMLDRKVGKLEALVRNKNK